MKSSRKVIATGFVALLLILFGNASAFAGYRGGINVYEYVESKPTTHVDPNGTLKYKIDEKACTIEMTAEIQYDFTGNWSDSGGHTNRKDRFIRLAEDWTESTFNSSNFRIRPNTGTGTTGRRYNNTNCCPCPTGFKPTLNLTHGRWGEDFDVTVAANLLGYENPNNPTYFLRSGVNIGAGTGTFDEADVKMSNKGGGNSQVPFVHEFGHLLGLQHPGQSLNPPAQPNSPADYAADAPALLGSGMQMRAAYYARWQAEINAKIGAKYGCNYTTR